MRTILYIVAIFAVLVFAFAYGVGLYLKASFPNVRGEELTGVSTPVELVRDRWGIPHISAHNAQDLFFAQGYVHAQDRRFQMEMYRRASEGRLSELVGEGAVELDRVWRAMRFKATAKDLVDSLTHDQLATLESYCRGVNAAARSNPAPLEFKMLGIEFEPWKPENAIEILLMNGWHLATNFHHELAALKLADKLPVDVRDSLFGFEPQGEELPEPAIEVENLKLLPGLSLWQRMSSGGRSNNWAVAPKRSKSNAALLANDPHLPVSMPSIWYEVHLKAPGIDVAGASIPGAPFVVLGHTRTLAWAFTNLMADNTDLVILETDPNDPKRYRTKDGWKEVEAISEVIEVKGGGERTVEVWWTDFGPLITDLNSSGTQVALAWSGHRVKASLSGFFNLNTARTAADAVEAARDFAIIAQNLVYADADGHIGWHAFGAVPVRRGYSGFYPVRWDRFSWDGYMPYDELPHVEDPEEGFVVTANAPPQNYDRPWRISHTYAAGYRDRRIRELLQQKEKLEPSDFATIQQDVYSKRVEIFQSLLEGFEPKTKEESKLKELITGWDRTLSKDSSSAAAYSVFRHYLWQAMLSDELGSVWPEYVFAFQQSDNPFDVLVQDRDCPFWDDVSTPDVESWQEIVARALDETWDELSSKLGRNPKRWAWGIIHRVEFIHPFRVGWPLSGLFNGGSVPFGGDNTTVNQGRFDHRMPYSVDICPSYRHIIDMSDPLNAVTSITTGQSGHIGHPHYRDQVKPWAKGYYHELIMDDKNLQGKIEAVLVLKPEVSQ